MLLYFNIFLTSFSKAISILLTSVIFFFNFNNSNVFADWARNWQLSFQDPASPICEGIINLHHDIFFILTFIAVFVINVIALTVYYFNMSRYNLDLEALTPFLWGFVNRERVINALMLYNPKFVFDFITNIAQLVFSWTLIPCLILMMIALPSFALIYSIDDMSKATFTDIEISLCFVSLIGILMMLFIIVFSFIYHIFKYVMNRFIEFLTKVYCYCLLKNYTKKVSFIFRIVYPLLRIFKDNGMKMVDGIMASWLMNGYFLSYLLFMMCLLLFLVIVIIKQFFFKDEMPAVDHDNTVLVFEKKLTFTEQLLLRCYRKKKLNFATFNDIGDFKNSPKLPKYLENELVHNTVLTNSTEVNNTITDVDNTVLPTPKKLSSDINPYLVSNRIPSPEGSPHLNYDNIPTVPPVVPYSENETSSLVQKPEEDVFICPSTAKPLKSILKRTSNSSSSVHQGEQYYRIIIKDLPENTDVNQLNLYRCPSDDTLKYVHNNFKWVTRKELEEMERRFQEDCAMLDD